MDRIIAYTYQAEILHPWCLAEVFGINPDMIDIEQLLDARATVHHIDRYDEHTFDSDDFPKVVFSSQVEDETCNACGEEI